MDDDRLRDTLIAHSTQVFEAQCLLEATTFVRSQSEMLSEESRALRAEASQILRRRQILLRSGPASSPEQSEPT